MRDTEAVGDESGVFDNWGRVGYGSRCRVRFSPTAPDWAMVRTAERGMTIQSAAIRKIW